MRARSRHRLLALVLLCGACEGGDAPFVSQAGRFSVVPPAPFKYTSQDLVIEQAGLEITLHVHEATTESATCWVAYFDVPSALAAGQTHEQVLDRTYDLLQRGYSWRVQPEGPIERSGRPGRQVRAWDPQLNEMLLLSYVSGTRVYFVSARRDGEPVRPPTPDVCLDSFTLLD